MGYLKILKVKYEGDKYFYKSNLLDKTLNIIIGDNGTGKSTFFDFIYFALGGTVKKFDPSYHERHNEVTSDTNNYVELLIEINSYKYVLKRTFSINEILIEDLKNEKIEILKINRYHDNKIFSDWLLEKIGINKIKLYNGPNDYILKLNDLLRLVYYDQETEPKKIYKCPDSENYISDSEFIRKVIFQVLIGKTYQDYYTAFSEMKKYEQEKTLAKSLLNEYLKLASELNKNNEVQNKEALVSMLSDDEFRLEKLYKTRKEIKEKRTETSQEILSHDDLKNTIIDLEFKLEKLVRNLNSKIIENARVIRYYEDTQEELSAISKIIISDNTLGLFSPDTCPYCLSEVNRDKNKCVCGNDIDESAYERFFYNRKEYEEIYKVKCKSQETVFKSIESLDVEIKELTFNKKELETSLLNKKKKYTEYMKDNKNCINTSTIDKVDDLILELKEKIGKNKEKLKIEEKLESLQSSYDTKNTEFESKKSDLIIKEAECNKDIILKINQFNKIYNSYVTQTLPDCRNAKIDLIDYMPIIDDGIYREFSSSVAIRFMYFLTILEMSLVNDDLNFPKLLLIDTPETAGIDKDKLNKIISQISRLSNSNYQIILSTARDKYPEKYKDNIVEDKLIKNESSKVYLLEKK
ncbi:hypothetical protein [Arcobacter sp.]|uniref:hypothetical protein n=1 Tax=Arcobacter sp. TaxID=1872629 RepID=UPI003C711DF4